MKQRDFVSVQYHKKEYPTGTRVLLVHMNDCIFDNGTSHTLIPGVDVFRKLKEGRGECHEKPGVNP